MTERTRAHLRQEFQDGERPSGADFADVFDSSLNKLDDGVSVDPSDNTLVVSRGLRLGDSADAQLGTLRFNGGALQLHDGTAFVNVGAGGGGAFQAVGGGPDVAYTGGGNVGIGNFTSTAPTYRLEVELGTNTGTNQQVRFGNAVIYRGTGAQAGAACLSHSDHADNNGFALRQRPTGEVNFNAPANRPLFFSQGGTAANTRMTISAAGAVLIATPSELTADPQIVLHVNGNAIKSTAGGNWATTSDARVKEEVTEYRAGLPEISAIRPVAFRYNGKAGTQKGSRGVGVIGQEIENVLPETVSTVRSKLDEESGEVPDLRIYDGGSLVYALVNAVKELSARVAALERAAVAAAPPTFAPTDAAE